MPSKRYGRSTGPWAALCVFSGLACVLAAPLAQAQATTQTFNPTGAEQTFTVPPRVTSINVLAIGEAGAKTQFSSAAGGLPAEVGGEVSVTPGQTLYVEVAQGSFNGGAVEGLSTYSGGGASDVRTSPRAAGLSPDTRLIVAGGGGGGGEEASVGAAGAGGNAGEPGKDAATVAGFSPATGGGAGTLTHGGAGGVESSPLGGGGNGAAGTLGSGGVGGQSNPSFGGGGGGGYYGGGGGGGGGEIGGGPSGGGGGGGSSLVPAGGSMALASLTAKPVVQISYTQATAPVLEWYSNGVLLGPAHQETTLSGNLSFENTFVGKVRCHAVADQTLWNEVGIGLGAIESLAVMPCSTEPACPGAFVTAETPVELHERGTTTEKVFEASRGKSTVPWTGEAQQEEGTEKLRHFPLRNVKLTEVAPCKGVELPYEGTLQTRQINGTRNGLKPSHLEFEGLLATKALPTEKENNILHVTGEVKDVGESIQLITLQ